MKRIWGRVLSLLVAGIAVSAVVPACATNDQSIFILGGLAPSANRVNGACIYTNDPQQAHLLEGTLDVGLSDSYYSVLLVGNQMIPRGDPLNNRAESNRVHIDGGVVRVTESDGTLIREFTSPGNGLPNPASNNTPDFAVVGMVTLDAPTADTLRGVVTIGTSKTVLVNIKAFGTTLGGTDLESGEYQFPLLVCNGCLVDFSTGNDPQQQPQPNCLLTTAAGGSGTTQAPCRFGQDEYVKCETCRALDICNPIH
jgi:hypothetical protein